MSHTQKKPLYIYNESPAGAEGENSGDKAAKCGVGECRRTMRERGVFPTERGGLWAGIVIWKGGKMQEKKARKTNKQTNKKNTRKDVS